MMQPRTDGAIRCAPRQPARTGRDLIDIGTGTAAFSEAWAALGLPGVEARIVQAPLLGATKRAPPLKRSKPEPGQCPTDSWPA